MSIEHRKNKEDGSLEILFKDMRRGVDSVSGPLELGDGFVADCQNVNFNGGFPTRLTGSILHDTNMITEAANETIWFDRYIPGSGTSRYIWGERDGEVFIWNAAGNARIQVRTGLTSYSAGDWASTVQLGDYMLVSDATNGNWKWDGSNYIPVGAKMICDMDSSEDSDWTNGSTETTTIREGIQSRSTGTLDGSANADITMTFNPSGTQDLQLGLLQAKNYIVTATDHSTAVAIFHFFINLSNATNFNATGTDSFFRIQSTAGSAYLQFDADTWGTLANGWNEVNLTVTAGDETGTFDMSAVDSVVFEIQSQTGDLIAIIDDCYVTYLAAARMPGGQINGQYRNMFLVGRPNAATPTAPSSGAGTTFTPSDYLYSKISAPDEWDANALLPISANDGDKITGTYPYFDQMIVGKDNSIHTLAVRTEGTTYPSYVWNTRRVTIEHGVSSHRSMIEGAGRVYMWWQDSLYAYEGIGTKKISYPVDTTLDDRDRAELDRITAGRLRDENILWWFWPSNGNTTVDKGIIFNYQEQAFLINAEPFDTSTGSGVALAKTVFDAGVEHLLTVHYNGRICRQNSGTSWADVSATSAIASYVTLPWVSGGEQDQLMYWAELLVQFQTNTGSLVVEYRIADHPREFDAASYSTAVSLNMATTDSFGRVLIGDVSRWIQLRFRTSAAPFSVYWPVHLYTRPLGARY